MRSCLLILVFSVAHFSVAQIITECSRVLADVEEAFEQGKLLYILDKNENSQFYKCLDDGGFSWVEEVRAHKLLTKTYDFTDNESDADQSFVNLLKTDKEHILSPEDPAELYYLYSKFITQPLFRVSAKVGTNISLPTVLQEFSAKTYNSNPQFGFMAEFLVEKHFANFVNGLEFGLGLNIWVLSYLTEGSLVSETFGENPLRYEATNRSSYLRFPFLLKYNFNYNEKNLQGQRKKFMPYVFVGGSYDQLLSAIYRNTQRQGGESFVLPEDGRNDLKGRNQVSAFNASIFAGGGIKMRVGRSNVDFMTVEFRYENMLFNYLEPENRFVNPTVATNIHLIEDDLVINAISFSVGYARSIYKNRKRKEFK